MPLIYSNILGRLTALPCGDFLYMTIGDIIPRTVIALDIQVSLLLHLHISTNIY